MVQRQNPRGMSLLRPNLFSLPQEVQSLVSLPNGEVRIGIPVEVIEYGDAKEFEAVHYLDTLAANKQGIRGGIIPRKSVIISLDHAARARGQVLYVRLHVQCSYDQQ